MREVAGKPLIGHVLTRLRRSVKVSEVMVITSVEPEDDLIEKFCASEDVLCFRGDLHNVASRFAQAILQYKLRHFLRLSGDSPLIDPRIIDRAVNTFESQTCDLVTNIQMRSFPKGQSVEVLSASAYLKGFSFMKETYELEHVTPYFYSHPNEFNIINMTNPTGSDLSKINLSVDTQDDLEFFKSVTATSDHQDMGWEKLAALRQSWDKLCNLKQN